MGWKILFPLIYSKILCTFAAKCMLANFFITKNYIQKIQNTPFFNRLSSQKIPENCYVFPEPDSFIKELKEVLTSPQNIVWIGCAKTGLLAYLSQIQPIQISASVIGFNEIPFFLQFPKIEICVLNQDNQNFIETFLKEMGIDYFCVEDAPGFVSPRVISMIINEAAFMVNEQIADFQSIDLGMKLGTNYPMGPSEWLEAIGIEYIYTILQNLHHRNPSGRYKISPYLQKLYYQSLIQLTEK